MNPKLRLVTFVAANNFEEIEFTLECFKDFVSLKNILVRFALRG